MAARSGTFSKKNCLNPLKNRKDAAAAEIDNFLAQFTGTGKEDNTKSNDYDSMLRAKVDAITNRVRHCSGPATMSNDKGEINPQEVGVIHQQPLLQEELPVKDRLDSLEVIVREIRDNMRHMPPPVVTSGQAQPQEGPLRSPLPARDHRERRPHGHSKGARAPSLSQAEPGPYLSGDSRRRNTGATFPAQHWTQHGIPRHRTQVRGAANRDFTHETATYTSARHRPHRQSAPAPHTHRRTARAPAYPSNETSSSSDRESESEVDSINHRNDPTSQRLLTHALARQYQNMGRSTGRQEDFLPPLIRPHDALPPDMKRQVRDRTTKKNRKDLTFPEFVCGYSRMLLSELDPHSDLYSMIAHLSHVAQDTIVAPWPAVRSWSNTCLDYVQEDNATWSDTALFAEERNRLVWSQARLGNTKSIPCPNYNDDTCKAGPIHTEGEFRLLHTCAVCYYATPTCYRVDTTTHNAKNCTRKKRPHTKEEGDGANKNPAKRQWSATNTMAPKKDQPESKSKN